jgi:hypothetical protein
MSKPQPAPAGATVASAQVVPTDLILKPGATVSFRLRLFDDRGRFIREETNAAWSLENLRGNISGAGQFASSNDAVVQAGQVKATVAGVSATAFVRVVPPLPWNENFDAMTVNTVPSLWVNSTGKFVVRDLDGNKVVVKTTEGSSLLSRARAFFGPADLANYTIEADVRATEKRRQMGDAGIIAGRYVLVLYGNSQKLDIEPWQPEVHRTASVPFTWSKDTWYRMKLQVENLSDGKVRVKGKVWPVGKDEPATWTIEHVDSVPNRQGAPGIFGNAVAEIYFDNLKVYANK